MDHSPKDAVKSRIGRRFFLSQSVAVGTVGGLTSLAPASRVLAASPPPEEPGCKASPADTLLLYLDLLLKVQSEAFSAASTVMITASKNCADTLQKLEDQLNILRAEIQNSHTTSQAQQMHHAVKLGNAQVEAIKASVGSAPRTTVATAAALTLVSDHINRTAQDLLPQGEIKLNAKAKEALEEVFRLVKKFQEVPEQTRAAQEEFQCRIRMIQTEIEAIRDGLFAASSSVTEAEGITSSVAQQEARNNAAQMIDDVKAKVAALKDSSSKPCRTDATDASVTSPGSLPATSPPSKPMPTIDLMVAILEGTARVVRNPQIIADNTRSSESQFVRATFREGGSTAESLFSRVQQAIDATCPRGTEFKTTWCINLILGPLAFTDTQTRISLIAGVLVLFPCWRGNKGALVLRLADL